MEFDRSLAFGKRLNIIASTAVRFEPGESKIVELVPYAGAKRVYGHNDLVNGDTETEVGKMNALKKADANGFKNKKS